MTDYQSLRRQASALAIALPLIIAAGDFALFSFFPRINLGWFLGGPRAGPHTKNLLYFGDIASLTVSDFRKEFHARYYPSNGRSNKQEYLDDLTVQIAINSQITGRKMWLFRWGLGLISVAAAVLTPPTVTWAWNQLVV